MLIFIPHNLAPDVWSWTEFLRAIIGPIIAAIFVVIGIALKERYDRRRTAQLWYEQYYITEGLDRLISYLMTVEMVIGSIHTNPDLSVLKLEAIPYEAFTRMQILLRRRDFVPLSMLFTWLPRYKENIKFVEAARLLAHGLQYNFSQLRQELLRLNVYHKSDVYKVAENRRIVVELDKIKQIMNSAELVINPILLSAPGQLNQERVSTEHST
jgi:hypothetical protein